MPPQGTKIAEEYDNLYAFLLWASLIGSMILIGGMIFFVVKYKRKTDHDKTPYISHNTFLEFIWSFIPLVIFLGVFVWGWHLYHEMRTMPENALEVNVFGRQWSWEFAYKSGKTSGKEFYVPVNTPVKLIMTSKDVLHSFYIPSMRIKQDVVPGMYTTLSFNAEKLGDYQIFCAEYCGTTHSGMLGQMHVVSQADFEKWLQENEEGMTLAEKGQKYFTDKGCVACHSVDGTPKVGPSWKGVFGLKEHEMDDGQKVSVDENYVRESILNPNAKVVKGYPKGVMPTFQGQLSEDQLNALIEFIKSLK
ncbi:MAG: cytochrome c oxidase subunit II [Bdellovibrio sp. CG10_big_fil_rev_8_21_14_0_10_47_8]|nr:MAG: cytochrome c oxidase subunit II [Bdellovibrio sp. CG10_big_fil_rev_8_21_14_0_10_47_8]